MQFDSVKAALERVLARADGSGTVTLDTGKAGPVMAVCALTHGNEISGILTVDRLLQGLDSGHWQLDRGSLRILLANYEILREATGFEALARHRGIDLNRIWSADLAPVETDQPGTHEFAVRERLLPALADVHCLIDLHSTSLESTAIGIVLGEEHTLDHISSVLDVPYLMPDIGQHLNGTAMIERHFDITRQSGASEKEAALGPFSLVIEAGQHFDFDTLDQNLENVVALLQLGGVLQGEARTVTSPPLRLHTYFVGLSTSAGPVIDWHYTDRPGGFDRVEHGELICHLHGEPVSASGETYIVMPQMQARNAGQEMFYLATPTGS
jgi:predicted deacylase